MAQIICLLALLSIALQAHGAALNMKVDELPAPLQTSKRLLATITSSKPMDRLLYLDKQLQNYVDICEVGFEVHVVFISWEADWEALGTALFTPASRFHCLRLSMNLPVAVATLAHGDSTIAARHRDVYSQKVDSYDYFISQEDDVDFKARHMHYFVHWLHVFKGFPTPTIPGFALYETIIQNPTITTRGNQTAAARAGANASVHVNNLANRDVWWHHPLHFNHITQDPMSIMEINNVTCLMPHKVYPAFGLVTQDMLRLGMSKKAWKLDINSTWQEFNTHFQYLWIQNYYSVAIPVMAFRHSMIHHGPDKYTPGRLKEYENFKDTDSRRGRAAAEELLYMIANCTGKFGDWPAHSPFLYPALMDNQTKVEYTSPPEPNLAQQQTPCAVCASRGKYAYLIPEFYGPPLELKPYRPPTSIRVHVQCNDGIPAQQTERCHKNCINPQDPARKKYLRQH